ncbi:hypothetical protein Q4Q39_09325 [Flavivirga amylovorans]|uniref:MarR family transcriptional regulator n=1 Tax=Flavivirga amylovorans TaxID=870486 RepID=A0ABT8X145_9FLAO|nr:hypothetical protein [Flavivirga amylovorans]MDO5987597.1 hypothetical protein [Flavivirga amylovorans]
METQKQFYPIFNNSAFYPKTLSSVLSIFYVSNQKYFTVAQLKEETQLSETEIEDALSLLHSLGDVGEKKNAFSERHFFVDTDGSIKNIKNSIKQSKCLLNVLEKILEKRNNTNEALNTFIKKAIMFYSETLDFISIKTEEYFKH